MWYSENGERLGTYDGHKGTVWWLDVTKDSQYLVTGGADMSVKVWRVKSGEMLHDFPHTGPVRHVEWSEGDKMFLTVADPFRGAPSTVSIFDFSGSNVEGQSQEPKYVWENTGLPVGRKITHATWTPLNKNIITTDDDGTIRVHEVDTGRVIREMKEHTKRINAISWNKEKFLFITGSADFTAKLWDLEEWKVLKTYETDRPVNSVAISPIKEHVFVAGGQEAMAVTTTSGKLGKFETKLFHTVFGEEFGNVRGHFGPVNTIAIHPDGTGFVSGSEDGYCRVHHFDKEYFQLHSELDDLEALSALTR